jgi:aspartate/methionine/tyrosine aminotransferase
MFSTRIPSDLRPNPVTRTLRRLRRQGTPILDLTESNPTRVGLRYPPGLFDGLASGAATYDPDPLGAVAARAAVAAYIEAEGIRVRPEQVVLTASTSDAYALLFKVLCDPGDEVLVPRPSYPLFDHLARLDAVVAVPYDLECHGRWSIDLDRLVSAVSPRTRAILVVSPNNPTGSYVTAGELEAIAALAVEHDLAVVGDEVFRAYPLASVAPPAPTVLDCGAPLTVSLGGLSKSVGLPQLKLSWMAIGGTEPTVEAAVSRLELACDTYLSVASPVQHALPELLTRGLAIRAQIDARLRRNLKTLHEAAVQYPECRVLPVEGGWSAIVQVPATVGEERRVLDLLEHHQVLVHPGYFFDFQTEAFLVCSLLPEPAVFDKGVAHLFTEE